MRFLKKWWWLILIVIIGIVLWRRSPFATGSLPWLNDVGKTWKDVIS